MTDPRIPRIRCLLATGASLADIGRELGITRQRVHQLVAERGLRHFYRRPSPELTRFHSIAESGGKFCKNCGLWKPLTEFSIANSRCGSRAVSCKPCRVLQTLDWIERNRDRYNASRRKCYHRRRQENKQ